MAHHGLTIATPETTLSLLLKAFTTLAEKGITRTISFDDATRTVDVAFSLPEVALLKFFNTTLNQATASRDAEELTSEIRFSKATKAHLYVTGGQAFYDACKASLTTGATAGATTAGPAAE